MAETIAVYGTLRKGHGNYRWYIEPYIKSGKAEFIGYGKVKGYLLGGGIVPFAKKTNNPEDWIRVEVYRIDDKDAIRSIDSLEGAYKKIKVNVELDDGNIIEAYMYDGSHLTTNAIYNDYEDMVAGIGRW